MPPVPRPISSTPHQPIVNQDSALSFLTVISFFLFIIIYSSRLVLASLRTFHRPSFFLLSYRLYSISISRPSASNRPSLLERRIGIVQIRSEKLTFRLRRWTQNTSRDKSVRSLRGFLHTTYHCYSISINIDCPITA